MADQLVPPVYREGYGELVRAHRIYLGLSQRSMAKKIGMAEKSLSDIEISRRECPPGLINTVWKIVEEFDADVDRVIAASEGMPICDLGFADIPVSDAPSQEWKRSVIGHAAVESRRIRPVIVLER